MTILPRKRRVAALQGDGRIFLIEQELPALKPGTVLVKVRSSLVSPGTELRGWETLSQQRSNPALLPAPKPFGYSNAGEVAAVGPGVTRFKAGDRVACIGGGYALHTDFALVPQNLCVEIPGPVGFDQASYIMLLATGMHALRRGQPQFGESTLVVGLGIVGLLTARIYQLAGNFVAGWDYNGFRVDLAKQWGLDAAFAPDGGSHLAATKDFTGGYGLDTAVIAFGGNADAAMADVVKCMKVSPDTHPMGTVVIVGGARFQEAAFVGSLHNMDIRRAARTGAGYHDDRWETEGGYPPVFMRWTTDTNLKLCMRLLQDKKIDVDALTTHRIPLSKVEEGIADIIGKPEKILGVIFHVED